MFCFVWLWWLFLLLFIYLFLNKNILYSENNAFPHQLSSSQICAQAASNSVLLQREASALNTQPPGAKWPVGGGTVSSEQLSLELHHVEREIGKRTREIAMVSPSVHVYVDDIFTNPCLQDKKTSLSNTAVNIYRIYSLLLLQENQVAQEVQYKLKATENGQIDHKAQLEELSLSLG